MKKMIVLMVVLVVASIAHASNGGVPVDYNKYPYISAMRFHDNSIVTQFCIASIIDKNMAFTTAHCFNEMPNASAKDLYVYMDSKLTPYRIKGVTWNGRYDELNPYFDTGVIYTYRSINTKKLSVNMDLDPFSYINSRPGKEILVPFFGLDLQAYLKDEIKVMSGSFSVMGGDKCHDQIQDFLDYEGGKLDKDMKEALESLVFIFGKNPRSFFCAFNKKVDKIQVTVGDSGSPLVVNYNGKDTLLGSLILTYDISKSQNYSYLLIFSNLAVSYDFMRKCHLNHGGELRLNEESDTSECVKKIQSYSPVLNLLLLN